MPSRAETLITVDELADLITAIEPIVVLDVRWQLDRPDGRDAYAESHIPGAVYVDLETELSDHSVLGRGRHPLPSGSALQATARRWGVRDGVPIIVYDNWNRAGSARAWWVLRAAGIADIRILDGGLGAWVAAGREVAAGAVHPPLGDVHIEHEDLYVGALATVDADEAAVLADAGALIDARAPERFRGEVEPVDAVPGHVPGARNVPSGAVLDEHGFFRPAAELEALFKQVRDADRVGAYCGSGVTAAVDIAALRVLGIDAALFPGSWSQWSSETGRPIATGISTPFPD
ncbi:sulfurtransferase [Nocardia sp. SYP-A9097]|uniref:sulfurtransferase n=1 Tax=Nocardia sp. SYP-A9097 TaxID=2663237 RepID=UPI00129B0F3E|nr:sulfurtransferase [Nocardia sp. SYP-A9097]MRH91252.1 sulfurtransferase [Nocardia sp. SYP-A9097]